MEEDLKPKTEAIEETKPAAAPPPVVEANNATNADPYGLNAANDLLSNPKVKKYMGRMSKVLIGFALLGSVMMIAAVTAITTLFNMIVPK